MKNNAFVQKMMRKWNVSSVWDFLAIMIVFSLAGMSIVFVRKPLYCVLLGITTRNPLPNQVFHLADHRLSLPISWDYWSFGFLFGQFEVFLAKRKADWAG